MLNQIIEYINVKESLHHNENDEDMLRNIIANLISTKLNLGYENNNK